MNRKHFILVILTLILILTACIKETYNMDKLSDKVKYSPTFSMIAANGDVSLRDMVKSNDTIVYDNDKFVRVIYKKDSVINLKLKDYYDLNNMVSFRQGYKFGELKIDDFQSSLSVSLNTISSLFTSVLRNLFVSYNDGNNHLFPAFPQTDVGEKPFSLFPNFQNAVFSSGTLTLSLKNNLTAPLSDIKVSLFNVTGHSAIGSQVTITGPAAGATSSVAIDLAGKTITNSILAAIIFTGSPGTSTPVKIDLNSSVQLTVSATNLKVSSGRVILPVQNVGSLSGTDIVSFNPGSGVEIEKLRVLTGNFDYNLISSSSISGSFSFTLPTALKSGVPVSEAVVINGVTNFTKSVSFNNTDVDLSTDVSQAFNRMPVNYTISVNSNGNLVTFNKNDSIQLKISMLNPNMDYVKGYFGQLTHQIDPDNLDTGLEDILKNITGQFHISNPTIRVNYSNSFGIPIELTLNATGKKGTQTVNLGLSPLTILSPTGLVTRDVSSILTVDKSNSSLADLLSLPPSQITFSGSAKMNPAGMVSGRNNYVFGTSRFLGNLEVEIPMQFWIKNLQFADTVDNFLETKTGNSDNNSINPSDFDMLQLNLTANNGFPLGASIKLMLYDSVKKAVIKTIDASSLLLPAPIDANGKATGKTESKTTIDFTKDFFSSINSANKIIFMFTLNSSENGTKDVKIYSDYSISFKASLVVKPNFNL